MPHPTGAAANLIKTKNSSTVYYVDENNIRHAFPNFKTYESWYGNSFSGIIIMSENYVASLPLGKNITLRPGKYLVKVPTLPEVYAVEPGGTLRHLASEEIAQKFYGPDWYTKIIDLPEVFFENYVIGEPIKYEYQVSDGSIYKLKDKDNYYYLTRGHAQKFASWNDVMANGYTADDVIEGITTFLLHAPEIKGYDPALHNLTALPNLANYDCENKNLKAAFIFVYDSTYTSVELQKIQSIKDQFSDHFNWATHGLSNLELDDEIFKIQKADYHLINNELSLQQISYDFYASHPDTYDFLFVFDNFSPSSKTIAKYNHVTNSIQGINRYLLKAETQYGSLGKLKGVIQTFDINDYYSNGVDFVLNNLMHETLHAWSGRLVFWDGLKDSAALLDEDKVHWSPYLNLTSPLGGYGWQDSGDGTFTQTETKIKKQLSNLDLYAMGLMPLQGIGEIFYIQPKDKIINTTINATRVDVDINSLEEAMGQWQCNIN